MCLCVCVCVFVCVRLCGSSWISHYNIRACGWVGGWGGWGGVECGVCVCVCARAGGRAGGRASAHPAANHPNSAGSFDSVMLRVHDKPRKRCTVDIYHTNLTASSDHHHRARLIEIQARRLALKVCVKKKSPLLGTPFTSFTSSTKVQRVTQACGV